MNPAAAFGLTPEWVRDCVFYQIFPDRFRRSRESLSRAEPRFESWDARPTFYGFQGGDLRGIMEKLDYLQDLGVTALYLNPIFASAACHRYHTYDFFRVDPLLGGMEAFRELLNATHARGMRLILDGVFNHVSRGFWAFHHVLENEGASPYADWFHIRDWPLRAYGEPGKQNYESWWNLPALPKLRIENPAVRDHLWRAVEFWTRQGIDGWRLDVPEEIQVEGFWEEFRRRVKQINPEAYIVGEIWGTGRGWLNGDRFDGITNYALGRHALGFFGRQVLPSEPLILNGHPVPRLSAAEFGDAVDRMVRGHDWEFTLSSLGYMDSHDTPRSLRLAGGDIETLKLMQGFQMTMPGPPVIYYGTEIGMDGGPDPDCRRTFPWQDRSLWRQDVLDHVRRLATLRRSHSVLRRGRFATLPAQGDVYMFKRIQNRNVAYAVFNAGFAPASVKIADPFAPAGVTQLRDGLSDAVLDIRLGKSAEFDLPARGMSVWLGHPD